VNVALTERDLESPDPLKLDREIARTADAVKAWRRRLRAGEGTDEDPFWSNRLVAGRTAFQVVTELPASDPLRVPLRRWIYRLAEQRINRAALSRIAEERRRTEHVISEPEHARLPLGAMLGRALGEPKRRDAWLASYLRSNDALGVAVTTLWERRQELASRMGLPGPDAIEAPGADVAGAATRFLERTGGMLELPRPTVGSLLGVALAEATAEGWPRHLLPRTLLDLFRDTDLFRGVELDPGALPEAHGPASFLRALVMVGAAWTDATAPRDQPFVVAHDPYGLRRHTMGALLGALPVLPTFARRTLGIDASKLVDHGRLVARALLVETRAGALRVLLRSPALAGRRAFREAFEGETVRAFGVPLRPEAAGTLWQPRADDPARFAGMLLAARKAELLREAHDVDWHRNPRATEQLRDESHTSPEPTTTDALLTEGADALYRLLSERL
jgi:hypothetical protein